MATFSHRSSSRAPTTIFAKSSLSPRQIATKTISLGCKKLERDDKRSRPQYHMLERLLLCNTISKAEELLNKRARRTNRRVMAAEEDEELFNMDSQRHPHEKHHHSPLEEHHSPLRSLAEDDNDDGNEEEAKNDVNAIETHLRGDDPADKETPPSCLDKDTSELSPLDCRPALAGRTHATRPIVAI